MSEILTRRISIVLLSISGVILIALQIKPLGWALLILTGASLLRADKKFSKDIFLIIVSLGILGITPINTDISVPHMILMGTTLFLAVAVPYIISRFIYQDRSVHFQWFNGRRWYASEVVYIGLTAVVAYFLLPYYLKSTGAYLNWPSASDHASIVRLFIGTNALGIWDELFFVSTVLGILRRYFNFNPNKK